MPQTTMLPVFTADYPILAKAQKPGGVTVLSAVGPGDVPNKPTYAAGTIQMLSAEAETQESSSAEEAVQAKSEEESDPDPSTTTVTRTTTRTTTRRR
jgi:hypothetical protein